MPIDLSREEFNFLPRKQKDLAIFDNLQDIKSTLTSHIEDQKKQDNNIKLLKYFGFVWCFILTVAVGLRKYIPLI